MTPTDGHPLHELIRRRWSPRAFAPRPVEREIVRTLLEAARWAASCNNAQPWRYIVVFREDEAAFHRMLGCLVEGNRVWARHAPVMMIALARTHYEYNGKPNRWAWHDVGAANAQLTAQATAMGLAVHQMAGYDADAVRERYALDPLYEPVTLMVVGYPGSPDQLDANLRERELAPRQRKPLEEIAFYDVWGQTL